MPTAATTTLSVRVLLFASYAEMLGLDSIELTFERPVTVHDVLQRLRALPGGEKLPPNALCAINLSQARLNDILSDRDELAVLPPLAGG